MSNLVEDTESNLVKLAEYLVSLPDDCQMFNMGSFPVDSEGNSVLPSGATETGVIANSFGFGPLAGIEPDDKDQSWPDYVYQKFGVMASSTNEAYAFMFGVDWRDYDNTPQGAADRIYDFVFEGVPYLFREMMDEYVYEDTAIEEYNKRLVELAAADNEAE